MVSLEVSLGHLRSLISLEAQGALKVLDRGTGGGKRHLWSPMILQGVPADIMEGRTLAENAREHPALHQKCRPADRPSKVTETRKPPAQSSLGVYGKYGDHAVHQAGNGHQVRYCVPSSWTF